MIYYKEKFGVRNMAKKKSKTQKLKKNQKTKQKKVQKRILEQTKELKKIQESGAVSVKKTSKKIKTPTKISEKGTKKLVDKEKVNYNIAINKKSQKQIPKKAPEKEAKRTLIEKEKVEYKLPFKEEIKEEPKKETKVKTSGENKAKLILTALLTSILLFFKRIGTNTKIAIENHKKNKAQRLAKKELITQIKTPEKKEIIIEPDTEEELTDEELEQIKKAKQEAKRQEIKKKNLFIRILYGIIYNRHIFFNAILIVFFIVLLIGLTRIESITAGNIFYISVLSIFLMAVAISYNKYISGKIFTILLCSIMGFAIYRMQYTYDFIRNLNSAVYEYKTYYVVTFNSSQNKSIYNINNKKVGLYKENTNNIERKLNTKLDKVNYIEYDDLNELYEDFYDQKYRAILVNENQYKYMKNLISENSRDVKILYEFKANAKK